MDPKGNVTLYRCYLIRNGRIELGYDINSESLADAISRGHAILKMQPQSASFNGIEIWRGESRVHGDDCYADDPGAPVVSPFQTGESTMFLETWFLLNVEQSSSVAGPPCPGAPLDQR
jgi:hypothetical protein